MFQDGSPNSLSDLLKELGLQKYAKNFFDADVNNIETFKNLTDDDLKEKIGIILIGPRRKLTTAIKCIRVTRSDLGQIVLK